MDLIYMQTALQNLKLTTLSTLKWMVSDFERMLVLTCNLCMVINDQSCVPV